MILSSNDNTWKRKKEREGVLTVLHSSHNANHLFEGLLNTTHIALIQLFSASGILRIYILIHLDRALGVLGQPPIQGDYICSIFPQLHLLVQQLLHYSMD